MSVSGRLLSYSPSLLNSYVECEHLVALELQVAAGALERPRIDNLQADLIRRKGEEHEAASLAALCAEDKHPSSRATPSIRSA